MKTYLQNYIKGCQKKKLLGVNKVIALYAPICTIVYILYTPISVQFIVLLLSNVRCKIF